MKSYPYLMEHYIKGDIKTVKHFFKCTLYLIYSMKANYL